MHIYHAQLLLIYKSVWCVQGAAGKWPAKDDSDAIPVDEQVREE